MKKLILTITIGMLASLPTFAQTKKDSLKVKADLDAISGGREINPTQKKSILHAGDSRPLEVDSTATKSDSQIPTPPTSNNPNPHEPAPVGVPPTPAPPANPKPLVNPQGAVKNN